MLRKTKQYYKAIVTQPEKEFENPKENIEINFDTYNDMCPECEDHYLCHINGIDYNKIEKCFKDLKR
jgi:hypothetical protein